jgi:hypothetical protein
LDGFFDSSDGEGLTLNHLLESKQNSNNPESSLPSTQLSTVEEERLNQIFEKANLYGTENQLTLSRPLSKSQRRRLAKQEVINHSFSQFSLDHSSITFSHSQNLSQLGNTDWFVIFQREKTLGPDWFHLSAPEMTDELKQDLKVLNLRNFINPKDIYKKPGIENPKYLEVRSSLR